MSVLIYGYATGVFSSRKIEVPENATSAGASHTQGQDVNNLMPGTYPHGCSYLVSVESCEAAC